jgi:hypothetical protein
MKLIPPNTTPDWTPSQDRVGLKRIEYHDDRGKWGQLQTWYVQDDAQHEANCKFFLAAPAMAAALEKAHLYMLNLPESEHDESREAYLAVTAALLAAGYTQSDPESLAADTQLVPNH